MIFFIARHWKLDLSGSAFVIFNEIKKYYSGSWSVWLMVMNKFSVDFLFISILWLQEDSVIGKRKKCDITCDDKIWINWEKKHQFVKMLCCDSL